MNIALDKNAPVEPAPLDDYAWRSTNVGRLFLFGLHAYEARLLGFYHASGFREIRPYHLSAMRAVDYESGTRIIDLAPRAGMRKSAMGKVVSECALLGLLEIAADPSDKRAKIVRYTAKGRRFVAVSRRAVQSIETEFASVIGARRFEEIRAGLLALREAKGEGAPQWR